MPGRRRSLIRAVAASGVLAAVVVAGGCAGGARDHPTNLLLVTLDTTRADRIGCYGADDAATPQLDRIASEGALLGQAVAVAPLTLPSPPARQTGRYPPPPGGRGHGHRA